MKNGRVKDEFARMELIARIEKARVLIGQYEAGLAFQRKRVEDDRYELGRLDERLGGVSADS